MVCVGTASGAVPAQNIPAGGIATVAGRVTDASGAVVAGAEVSLETQDGRAVAKTVTDAAGAYRLTAKPQAELAFRERITAPGFRPFLVEGLQLAGDTLKTENARLAPGDANESVIVTASSAINNGEVATEAQLGILGTLDEYSTPFSVSAFTDTLVRDQQAQTVSDVLQNVPGIQDANGRYSEDSYLQFRGFPLDPGASLLNGLPYLVDYRNPSLENVARVELFKGPSSLINGANEDSSVGGTVNLVTKRAGAQPLLAFDGGYSSDSDFEGHLDAGRRWFTDGLFGVRGQLGGRDGATPVDNQTDHIANVSVGADVRTPKFRAGLDASDQYRGLVAERGALQVTPGFAVPAAPSLTSNLFDRSTAFTKHQYLVLGQTEYTPNTHVLLLGAYGHTLSPETYQGPYSPQLLNSAGDATVLDIPFHDQERVDVGRVSGRLTFNTGPLLHQVTAGGDFTHQRTADFFEVLNSIRTNIYHPVPLSPLTSHKVPLKNIHDTTDTRNNSFVAVDLVTALHGKLILLGGLRDQSIRAANLGANTRGAGNTDVFTPCASACLYDKTGVSPSGAGLYHLTQHLSVYANYIQDLEEGPTAPVGAANAGLIFPPTVSQQEEAGAKYEFAHAGATLALFRITEPNGVLDPSTLVFGLSGQQRNLGLEAEYYGNLTSSLNLVGGLTVLNARQQNTGAADTENKRAQGVPALELSEGAEWKPLHVRALTLTGRVTASSGQYPDVTETQRIPAWARLDIGGRYSLPFRYEPTLRVNFDNATGHNYWESGLQGLSYGTPRAVRVSTGFRF